MGFESKYKNYCCGSVPNNNNNNTLTTTTNDNDNNNYNRIVCLHFNSCVSEIAKKKKCSK